MEHKELMKGLKALLAVIELHKPVSGGPSYPPGFPVADDCAVCQMNYPCPTIQAIEKELE